MFDRYPHTDFNEVNLDWMMKKISRIGDFDSEIERATKEADRAATEADRATTEADRAGTEADNAKDDSDRATTEADRAAAYTAAATVEADRATTEADRAATEADRAAALAAQSLLDYTNLSNRLNDIQYQHFTEGTRYYINGNTGNDNNDGSRNSPFKTLEHFLDILNSTENGNNDARAYIMTAGDYAVSENKHVFSNCTLHIAGQDTGIRIVFETARDVKFYQSHLNFSNVTIAAPTATELAIDGGSFSFTTCTFEEELKIYAAMGILSSCVFPTLRALYSRIRIHSPTVTNTDNTKNAYYFDTSFISVSGSSQQTALTSSGGTFMQSLFSVVNWLVTYRTFANNYIGFATLNGGVFLTSETSYNYIVSRSDGFSTQNSPIIAHSNTFIELT